MKSKPSFLNNANVMIRIKEKILWNIKKGTFGNTKMFLGKILNYLFFILISSYSSSLLLTSTNFFRSFQKYPIVPRTQYKPDQYHSEPLIAPNRISSMTFCHIAIAILKCFECWFPTGEKVNKTSVSEKLMKFFTTMDGQKKDLLLH